MSSESTKEKKTRENITRITLGELMVLMIRRLRDVNENLFDKKMWGVQTISFTYPNIEDKSISPVSANMRLTRGNDFSSNYNVIDSLAIEIFDTSADWKKIS